MGWSTKYLFQILSSGPNQRKEVQVGFWPNILPWFTHLWLSSVSQLASICNLDKLSVEGAVSCLNFLSLSGSAKLPWPKTRLGRAYFALRRQSRIKFMATFWFCLHTVGRSSAGWEQVWLCQRDAMFFVCFECLRHVFMVTERLFSTFSLQEEHTHSKEILKKHA